METVFIIIEKGTYINEKVASIIAIVVIIIKIVPSLSNKATAGVQSRLCRDRGFLEQHGCYLEGRYCSKGQLIRTIKFGPLCSLNVH